MKLLSKSQVNTAKAADRKQAIDEGLKLAKKVDNLREIAVAEEESLSKYRVKTLEALSSEITAKAYERDLLKVEVADLELKRSDALEPFKKLRDELPKDEKVIWDLHDKLTERKTSLDVQEDDINKREKRCHDLENSTKNANEDANRRLKDASLMEENAYLQLEKARGISIDLAAKQVEQDKYYTSLDKEWRGKYKEISAKESAIDEKEKDLANRERALTDKYQTFIRATTKYSKPK